MRLFTLLLSLLVPTNSYILCDTAGACNITDSCVTFHVSPGTGCAWMCQYCSDQLGTNNYYFTDAVCQYESGIGCQGNPQADVDYTCCSM